MELLCFYTLSYYYAIILKVTICSTLKLGTKTFSLLFSQCVHEIFTKSNVSENVCFYNKINIIFIVTFKH